MPIDQIDPMYFERGYFLAPDKGAMKAYRLLARTLEDTLPPLKINTVLGYPGGSEIDIAVEKGEVVCRGMTASPNGPLSKS